MRANYGNLEPYGVEEKLCTCGGDTKKNDIQCDSSKVKVCNNPRYHISPLQSEECRAMRTDDKPYSMHDTINYLPSNSKTSLSRATHNHHFGIYPKVISVA